MTAFLAKLRLEVIRWALCTLALFAVLILMATLDGPTETDAAQASALAHQDAIAAARDASDPRIVVATGSQP